MNHYIIKGLSIKIASYIRAYNKYLTKKNCQQIFARFTWKLTIEFINFNFVCFLFYHIAFFIERVANWTENFLFYGGYNFQKFINTPIKSRVNMNLSLIQIILCLRIYICEFREKNIKSDFL